MRKRYIILCFGIGLQALGSFEAKAHFMGMGPLPFPPQVYQANPASKMTPLAKKAVNEAFSWAGSMFQKNHARCNNRTTCLASDLQTLDAFAANRPTHPAKIFLQNIANSIRHDSQHQKFAAQWVIFQNLSPKRQEEYRNGVRITPVPPRQIVRAPSGKITPAIFNLDDVLTDLLEKVDHSHKNCERYATCLSTDLQIIKGLRNRLAPADPTRKSLDNLSATIKALANQKIFDTGFYLKLYNPFNADWNNTLKQHKAEKTTAYGHKEWRAIEKHSRAVSWLAPRIINGLPLKPQQPPAPAQKKAPPKWWPGNPGVSRRWW